MFLGHFLICRVFFEFMISGDSRDYLLAQRYYFKYCLLGFIFLSRGLIGLDFRGHCSISVYKQ